MANAQTTQRWALITGASAGIGLAFARELASRGISVVLTARRADRLTSAAEEIRQACGVRVETVVADLAHPASPSALVEEIHARGIAIDWLINNAGYGVPGHYLTPTWETHSAFIQVLMTAPCELAYRLLPGMQQRNYGRIANIASLAGHVPGSAGHTLYGASKAFMIKFSQSLALENRNVDIKVCAVCPGFTFSEFHDVTGTRALVSKMPSWMWLSAAEVARDGIDATERGDIVRVTGRVNRLIKSALKIIPDRLALALVQRRSKDFRAGD